MVGSSAEFSANLLTRSMQQLSGGSAGRAWLVASRRKGPNLLPFPSSCESLVTHGAGARKPDHAFKDTLTPLDFLPSVLRTGGSARFLSDGPHLSIPLESLECLPLARRPPVPTPDLLNLSEFKNARVLPFLDKPSCPWMRTDSRQCYTLLCPASPNHFRGNLLHGVGDLGFTEHGARRLEILADPSGARLACGRPSRSDEHELVIVVLELAHYFAPHAAPALVKPLPVSQQCPCKDDPKGYLNAIRAHHAHGEPAVFPLTFEMDLKVVVGRDRDAHDDEEASLAAERGSRG